MFSVLADADSPANFLLRQQPWLQAAYSVMHEGSNTREIKGKGAEQFEVRAGAGERKVCGIKRGKEREEEESERKRRRVVEAREREEGGTQKVIGHAVTARVANTSISGSSAGNHRSSQLSDFAVDKNASQVQPKSCEHAPLVQPESCEHAQLAQPMKIVTQEQPADTDSECDQQERLQSFAERLRAKPVRECVRDIKKLQRRHVYIGRGACISVARDQSGPIRFRPRGTEGKAHWPDLTSC